MKPYAHSQLPLKGLDYSPLLNLVVDENSRISEYNGLLHGIPNAIVMLSPLTTKEAILSSRIEGTEATMDEVVEHEAGLVRDGEKGKDIQEIRNYRATLLHASEHIEAYPINLGLILQLHKILLDSVRGEGKSPGMFRQDQNWIGTADCSIEEASFVPPSHLIRKLKDNGLLVELDPASGRRSATLAFRNLINLVEGKIVL